MPPRHKPLPRPAWLIVVTLPDPDGAGDLERPETLYAYDAAGNVVQYTDRNGRVTEYDYDHLHRRTAETWLDGQTIANTIEQA